MGRVPGALEGEWIQYRILRDQWNPQIEFEITATFGLPDVTPENVGEHFARVRRACEEQGRDPATLRMSVVLVVACGKTKDEIARRYDRLGLRIEGLRTSCARFALRSGGPSSSAHLRRVYLRSGTPPCRNAIRRYWTFAIGSVRHRHRSQPCSYGRSASCVGNCRPTSDRELHPHRG